MWDEWLDYKMGVGDLKAAVGNVIRLTGMYDGGWGFESVSG
jgi:hypothetical protein